MGLYILVYEINSMEDNVYQTFKLNYETERELHNAVDEVLQDSNNKIIVAGYLQTEYKYKPVKYAVKYEPIN